MQVHFLKGSIYPLLNLLSMIRVWPLPLCLFFVWSERFSLKNEQVLRKSQQWFNTLLKEMLVFSFYFRVSLDHLQQADSVKTIKIQYQCCSQFPCSLTDQNIASSKVFFISRHVKLHSRNWISENAYGCISMPADHYAFYSNVWMNELITLL